jgi:hypothetical protein
MIRPERDEASHSRHVNAGKVGSSILLRSTTFMIRPERDEASHSRHVNGGKDRNLPPSITSRPGMQARFSATGQFG